MERRALTRLRMEHLENRQMLSGDGVLDLVRTFDTWDGAIPSTDASGLTYHPGSGHLYISDSEIDDLTGIFTGENVWEVTTDGATVVRGIETNNSEPSGIAYNAFDDYFYIVSDKGGGKISRYDINLNDRLVVELTDESVPGWTDIEGITADPETGRLYIVNGNGAGTVGVLVYDADLNFLYNFATNDRLSDSEGVAFNPETGHLFIVDGSQKTIFEYTVNGTYVATYSAASLSPSPIKLKGATFAPTSDTGDSPSALSLYLTDAGHDEVPDGRVYEVEVIEPAAPSSGVIDVHVTASSDDGFENSDGTVKLGKDTVKFHDSKTVGLRFTDIVIPQGAVIDSAHLQFDAAANDSADLKIKFRGQDANDASTFSNSSFNISSRPRTDVKVTWKVPDWSTGDSPGSDQRTPDLATIVQEIVDRSNWKSGNALAILATSKFSGTRKATTFDDNFSKSPSIHIEWHLPCATCASIDVPVVGSSDDAFESSDGSIDTTKDSLKFRSDKTVGLRFNSISIPQGSVIEAAWLQFDSVNNGSENIQIKFFAQDTDNAATFTNADFNVTSRATTDARVKWSPVPGWSDGESGSDQMTPDLSEIIQEVVDRPGWNSGNSVVIVAKNKYSGERRAASFDDGSSDPPTLHIEYRAPSVAPPLQAGLLAADIDAGSTEPSLFAGLASVDPRFIQSSASESSLAAPSLAAARNQDEDSSVATMTVQVPDKSVWAAAASNDSGMILRHAEERMEGDGQDRIDGNYLDAVDSLFKFMGA